MSAPQTLLTREPPANGEMPQGVPGCDVRSADEEPDDLSALRIVKVPDWPPFDGDPAAGQSAAPVAGWPGAATGCGNQSRGKSDGGGVSRAAGTAGTADRLTADRLEASSEWARQFARLLTEALAGARPIRQILPWTSERARVHLRRLMPMFGGGQRPHVLRVLATRPTREVIEMTVIVAVGTRTRALAVRLEQAAPRQLTRPGATLTPAAPAASTTGWVCTDIEAA
jgi:hypothetical protein